MKTLPGKEVASEVHSVEVNLGTEVTDSKQVHTYIWVFRIGVVISEREYALSATRRYDGQGNKKS